MRSVNGDRHRTVVGYSSLKCVFRTSGYVRVGENFDCSVVGVVSAIQLLKIKEFSLTQGKVFKEGS